MGNILAGVVPLIGIVYFILVLILIAFLCVNMKAAHNKVHALSHSPTLEKKCSHLYVEDLEEEERAPSASARSDCRS